MGKEVVGKTFSHAVVKVVWDRDLKEVEGV